LRRSLQLSGDPVILSGSAKPAVRLPLNLHGSLHVRNSSVAARGEESACRAAGGALSEA
jgi:hypothetical protein